MAETKTKPTAIPVESFIAAVEPEQRRADAKLLCATMARLSGFAPTMWGASIIGFGRYHYRYESGREGDGARIGFSPRKAALVLYLGDGDAPHHGLLDKLGKHKMGKGCLYINKLSDVDGEVLDALIRESLAERARRYPE